MWKLVKLNEVNSPFEQILTMSEVHNLFFIIYNIDARRIDCASIPPSEMRGLALNDNVLTDVQQMIHGENFVIFACDKQTESLYFLSAVPNLEAASACLMSIISDAITVSTPNGRHNTLARAQRIQHAMGMDRRLDGITYSTSREYGGHDFACNEACNILHAEDVCEDMELEYTPRGFSLRHLLR